VLLAHFASGGVENETVVTFTNAVATGRFKVCKVSSESTLQGVPFANGNSASTSTATPYGRVQRQRALHRGDVRERARARIAALHQSFGSGT
jgi:hypothetical protein